jgi:hypothetical protein
MNAFSVKSAVTLIAAGIAGLTLATSAPAAPVPLGEITRADASPDWTRGSIAGLVRDVPDSEYRVTHAWAFVLPNSAPCEQLSSYPNGGVGLVWESAYGDQNRSFDIPDLPLNSGIAPRLCLYGYLVHIVDVPTDRGEFLLSSRTFTVPPAPSKPRPPATPQPTAVTLSRTTAYAKAKSALKARFGRAYRRGKSKRIRCGRRSSRRYRCTFSFRYRKKLRKGIVTVVMKPHGSVSTEIQRRATHADS